MAPTHLTARQIKEQGVVFTPRWIVDTMLNRAGLTPPMAWRLRLLDPACGDGAFLEPMARRIIWGGQAAGATPAEISSALEARLTGLDLDPTHIDLAGQRLDRLASEHGLPAVQWDLRVVDSTDPAALAPLLGQYDLVVGNPPYVRIQHLGAERRAALREHWSVVRRGSGDLYLAFFEVALRLLAPGGMLAYITPNSWLTSGAGADLRRLMLAETVVQTIVDFKGHQVFPNATTYAAITIARRGPALSTDGASFDYHEPTTDDVAHTRIGAARPIRRDSLPADGRRWTLVTDRGATALDALNPGGPTLGSVARISTGLATLADPLYIFHLPGFDPRRDATATLTLRDGRTFTVERDLLRPIVKASTLKRDETTQHRWILFPYRQSATTKRAEIIPEAELRRKFPLGHAYLTAVRPLLDARDKGKPNPVAWYAFGRSQGLDSVFGPKILTGPFNPEPNFIVWSDPAAAFYSGYAITWDGDLTALAAALNSPEMTTWITHTSKDYQHGWKSYAKGYIKDFPLPRSLVEPEAEEAEGGPPVIVSAAG